MNQDSFDVLKENLKLNKETDTIEQLISAVIEEKNINDNKRFSGIFNEIVIISIALKLDDVFNLFYHEFNYEDEIKFNFDFYYENPCNNTNLLHFACLFQNYVAVKKILEKWKTEKILIIEKEKEEIEKDEHEMSEKGIQLISKEAEICQGIHETPLSLSVDGGFPDPENPEYNLYFFPNIYIINILLQNGASHKYYEDDPLFLRVVKQKNVELFNLLLNEKAFRVCTNDSDILYAFLIACDDDNLRMIKAIFEACQNEDIDKKLIQQKLQSKNNLFLSRAQNFRDIVNWFFSKDGAGITCTQNIRSAAINSIELNNNSLILEILLEKDLLTIQDLKYSSFHFSQNILIIALIYKKHNVCKLLLEKFKNLNVDHVDRNNCNALIYACANNSDFDDIKQKLIEQTKNVTIISDNNPFQYTYYKHHTDNEGNGFFEVATKRIYIETKNTSALFLLIKTNSNILLIEALLKKIKSQKTMFRKSTSLQKYINMSFKDHHTNSPYETICSMLHVIENKQYDKFKLLLDNGADLYALDCKRKPSTGYFNDDNSDKFSLLTYVLWNAETKEDELLKYLIESKYTKAKNKLDINYQTELRKHTTLMDMISTSRLQVDRSREIAKYKKENMFLDKIQILFYLFPKIEVDQRCIGFEEGLNALGLACVWYKIYDNTKLKHRYFEDSYLKLDDEHNAQFWKMKSERKQRALKIIKLLKEKGSSPVTCNPPSPNPNFKTNLVDFHISFNTFSTESNAITNQSKNIFKYDLFSYIMYVMLKIMKEANLEKALEDRNTFFENLENNKEIIFQHLDGNVDVFLTKLKSENCLLENNSNILSIIFQSIMKKEYFENDFSFFDIKAYNFFNMENLKKLDKVDDKYHNIKIFLNKMNCN